MKHTPEEVPQASRFQLIGDPSVEGGVRVVGGDIDLGVTSGETQDKVMGRYREAVAEERRSRESSGVSSDPAIDEFMGLVETIVD